MPAEVIAFAARLLPDVAPGLATPTSVREGHDALRVERGIEERLVAVVTGLAARPGTVGVVTPDARATAVRDRLAAGGLEPGLTGEPDDADRRLEVVPASLAKGLEFDHVVVVEPAALVAAEPDETTGLRRLYVCLTRAVSALVVLHDQDLPHQLGPTLSR